MMQRKQRHQEILAFLYNEHADIEPIKTRRIADAIGISVYSARYYLLQLQNQQCVRQEHVSRGSSARWTLLTDNMEFD
ncbi:FaeA/PapI family transcriptional regulator [Aeromonas dhakensis]|uniref:FaeA/PapI family transcriptional regulator n=1 Tax=Aeromonas dhakensis TaxID=196024 RepID=UPI0039B722CB